MHSAIARHFDHQAARQITIKSRCRSRGWDPIRLSPSPMIAERPSSCRTASWRTGLAIEAPPVDCGEGPVQYPAMPGPVYAANLTDGTAVQSVSYLVPDLHLRIEPSSGDKTQSLDSARQQTPKGRYHVHLLRRRRRRGEAAPPALPVSRLPEPLHQTREPEAARRAAFSLAGCDGAAVRAVLGDVFAVGSPPSTHEAEASSPGT